MSTQDCPPPCQKLLLCMACAGYGLLVQARAQSKWLSQGKKLSALFLSNQSVRLETIRQSVNICFRAIGGPAERISFGVTPTTVLMKELGESLLILADVPVASPAIYTELIRQSEIVEDAIDDNQTAYLADIGYLAA